MASDRDQLTGGLENENTGGVLTGFLADEEDLDRRALWRLGSWGVASVGAVIVALLANQSRVGLRRDQVAAADLVRQSQQISPSPRRARARRGGSPPRLRRSTATATGCIRALRCWNRGWIR